MKGFYFLVMGENYIYIMHIRIGTENKTNKKTMLTRIRRKRNPPSLSGRSPIGAATVEINA